MYGARYALAEKLKSGDCDLEVMNECVTVKARKTNSSAAFLYLIKKLP